MFKYINKNNNLNKLIINSVISKPNTISAIGNGVRNISFTSSKPLFDKVSERPPNPLYHRNSTLYSDSTREVINKIEKEFVMQPSYEPKNLSDKFALNTVKFLRKFSNIFFKEKFLHYAIVLETVAAVPGLVAGMFLHLKSLRTMEQNNWIKILMDEMENERMHLLSFIELTKPSLTERALVAAAQAVYWNLFLAFYVLSPKTAHRFTGYLEEQAVITYTHMLADIDSGKVPNMPAAKLAIQYWGLPEDATLRDMILVIRQDEQDHRIVNHEISNKISLKNNEPISLINKHNNPMIENPIVEPISQEFANKGIVESLKVNNSKINPTSHI